ncbi:MAG: peptidylprolyl isomerase [Acidobacteriota bacterium]|nr:peptidylprolyl isomerase [Acidobacteriota bacterium]
MKLRKLVPLFVLPLLCLPLTADTVVEEIVARINGEIITRSEFQQSRETVLNELKQKYGTQAEQMFAGQEKDVLRDLIDQRLLVQRGKDLGINPDTEVIKRLDEMRKQMNLASLEDLEKQAEQQGVSYEEVKENIRSGLITQKVIGQEVGSKIQIPQEDVRQYYQDHQKELERPEQVRLSEILVTTQSSASQGDAGEAARLAAAEQKANDLREQIRKGASFEEVAKKYSSGGSAEQGGDLGYFGRGKLAKELEDKTFGMQVNEVSEVIRTKQGFILLKVTEHQLTGVPAFKEIETKIQEALYYQKLQPAMRTYLTKLREEAYIDIKQGYVDSGASPNQTKPIMTAAQTEQEKKKKKKKLLVF